MQSACDEIFLKNMSYWKANPNRNGSMEPPSDLQKEMCPGLCSGNGICINSACKCNEPFTGDDCSVSKKIPPTIESFGRNGLCDIQKHSDCHIVRIRGRGFLENENLACYTRKLKVCYFFSLMHLVKLIIHYSIISISFIRMLPFSSM